MKQQAIKIYDRVQDLYRTVEEAETLTSRERAELVAELESMKTEILRLLD